MGESEIAREKDTWIDFVYCEAMHIERQLTNDGIGKLIDGESYSLRWREGVDFVGIYGKVRVEERNGNVAISSADAIGWIISRVINDVDVVQTILDSIVVWQMIVKE